MKSFISLLIAAAIVVFSMILSSCEDRVFCDCDALRVQQDISYEAWMTIVSNIDSTWISDTTYRAEAFQEWHEESVSANKAYVNAYDNYQRLCINVK